MNDIPAGADLNIKLVIAYLKAHGISRARFEHEMRARADKDLAAGKPKHQVMWSLDTAMEYWDQ